MKAIIQISMKSSHNDDFSNITDNLLKLKVCGKELFTYYLDLLNELNVDEIHILSNEVKNSIDEFYLSKVFSPTIKFVEEISADDYYLKHLNNFDQDEVMMIKNMGFVFNSFIGIKEHIENQTENFMVRDNNFEILYIKEHMKPFYLTKFLKIKAISTIKDYIYVNDLVLNKLEKVDYTNGYSQKNGIVIGKNVQIDKSTKLVAPLVIQDDVKVLANCTIGPNTVLSNNVFIENNTVISDSLILENTYIGMNLSINNKIVIESKLIDKKDLHEFKVDKKFISNNNLLF